MIYLDVTSSCKAAKNTGIQRMTRALYTHLCKHLAVTPICWNKNGRHYHHLGRREMEILETPFRNLSKATAKPEWRGENVFSELHRLAFRKRVRFEDELTPADIVLVPDFYSDMRTRCLPELMGKTNVRSVAIFHDAAALRSRLSLGARRRFRNYLESLASFDLVICISQESQEDLLRRWNQSDTTPAVTCVEPWPIEFAQALRRADSASQRKIVIACVCTFEKRKNHLRLLAAAEKLWVKGYEFELQLVGRTTANHAPKILPAIWRLQRRGRPLRWLRHVTDDILHDVYRSCRFTVYPSLFEGFGLPIAESLWHGKPCICGGNGALGEVAGDGGCLIVDQTSVNALASGIERLLADEELYAQLCLAARARRFRSWSNYTERLLKHLSALRSELAPAHC